MKREKGYYWDVSEDGKEYILWFDGFVFKHQNPDIENDRFSKVEDRKIIRDSELSGKNLQLQDHNKELLKINENLRNSIKEIKMNHLNFINSSFEISKKLIDEISELKKQIEGLHSIL